MSEDIVTRLREDSVFVDDGLLFKAADEIESLRQRLHHQNEYSLKLQNELEQLRHADR